MAPILAYAVFNSIEIGFLVHGKAWMEGTHVRPWFETVLWIGGLWLVMGLSLFGMIFVAPRWSRPSVESDSRGLRLLDRKEPCVLWEDLEQVFIEPAPNQPDVARITLHAFRNRKRAVLMRPWTILLEKASQLPQWAGTLRSQHLLHPTFGVRVVKDPLPPPAAARFHAGGMCSALFGLWLLQHGLLLVFIALADPPPAPETDFKPPAAFVRFVVENLHSLQEWRSAHAKLGGALSAAGAVFYFVGNWKLRRQNKDATARSLAELKSWKSAAGEDVVLADQCRH